MRKKLSTLLLIIWSVIAQSKEGMYLPILLDMIMGDMQAGGLKLSADDIYSINHSSLKDGVVRFGGGCTAEIISQDGLLLTNHHCGYGTIQSHSSLEHDYLTDGFWAKDKSMELPNPGLSVTFIVRMEDVTTMVMQGISDKMDKVKSDSIQKLNSDRIIKAAVEGNYGASVLPFSNGNQYILVVTETFRDIRLVGAPPSSIGKYGFDTDNWMWPRHTGDFSLFRIYAGKDNKPADYNVDNIPYKPRHHFPISLKGYKEGDFTMVYGFPYRTEEYLTAEAVDYIINVSNPVKIEIRTRKLDVLEKMMGQSDEVRIKYAAKQSSTSNAWKKWIGQNKALKSYGALEKKRAFDEEMKRKLALYPDSFAPFLGLPEKIRESYLELAEVALSRDYYQETVLYGVDALKLAHDMITFVEKSKKKELTEADIDKLKKIPAGFFKNFDKQTDLEVFKTIFPLYVGCEDNFYKADILKDIKKRYSADLNKWMEKVYSESILTNSEMMRKLIEKDIEGTLKRIEKDALYQLTHNLTEWYRSQISPSYRTLSENLESLNRKYIKAIWAIFPDRLYYPDANATLRVAYGHVQGLKIADGIEYRYYTTLGGVIEKYDSSSYEFDLPVELLKLYEDKDYGDYSQDGEMRVCFLASNHTSGGNSGSPVLNSEGHLIGLNFDRNWEGTMSDIIYDADQCRNISVDIRYVLFIIEKFAGAEHLIRELTLTKQTDR